MQTRNSVCLQQRMTSRHQKAEPITVDILLRLEFSSLVMMSGVIAKRQSSSDKQQQDAPMVYLKGAPFEVAGLVGFASLPQGWGAVCSVAQLHPCLAGRAHVHSKCTSDCQASRHARCATCILFTFVARVLQGKTKANKQAQVS